MKEGEYRPQPRQEGGNGVPRLPIVTPERAKPPPASTLSRAVERTRELYERNGWIFLPLGEAWQGSSELWPPEPSDNTSKTGESDLRDGYEDFIFRSPFRIPVEGFPRDEPTSQQLRQAEQMQPLQGRAEGEQSLQGPTTVDRSEPLQSQPGSALSRAVERTRDLYERNGWVFLPLGEAGKGNASIATTAAAESPQAEINSNSPVIDPPKRRRRSLTFPCPPISEMDSKDWRSTRRQNPPSSTDH